MKDAGPCYRCKSTVWIPDALYDAAQKGRGRVEFFCAYGHGQVFSEGESDEQKLRRERDTLKQQMARLEQETREAARTAAEAIARAKDADERARQAEQRATGHKTQATHARKRIAALKARVSHGVCPCCNRTFGDLARHMATKHAEYAQEAAE